MIRDTVVKSHEIAERALAGLPPHVRWAVGNSPLGYNAGDANLYRYVGNSPTNTTDPTGLWTWKLDSNGRLLASAEKGDTLISLINEGYDETTITRIGREAKFKLDTKLEAGTQLDLTSLLPHSVQDAIRCQQGMDYELMRNRIENFNPQLPKVPQGKTIGSSGIDLALPTIIKDGDIIQQQIHDNKLGLGSCHGFTALMIGVKLPKGVYPQEFSMGALKGEKYFDEGGDKPGTQVFKSLRDTDAVEGWYYPERGLYAFVTQGRKVTSKPTYGAIALFFRDDKITHSAFVLGQSNSGDIYLLQKLNSGQGIVITNSKHPGLEGFGKPTYYDR